MAEPTRPKPIPRKMRAASTSSYSSTPNTPVSELPEELTCPVCKDIINNPMLLSCCGVHLCGSCVKKIKESPLETGNHCPYCKEVFTTLQNQSIQRKVNEVPMYCPNNNLGCLWIGDFSKMDAHVDRANSQQEGNCQYQIVACRNQNCTAAVQRRNLIKHESEECPQRAYTCHHCGQYESTYYNVCREHFPTCESFPMACPNECSSITIPRGLISDHLSKDCPLEDDNCEYFSIGCPTKTKRGELHAHSMTNAHYHNTLLLKELIRVKETMEERNRKLQEECQDLRDKNKQLSSELALLKVQPQVVYEELEAKIIKTGEREKKDVAKLTERVEKLERDTTGVQSSVGSMPSATPEVQSEPSGNSQEPRKQEEANTSLREAVREIKEDISYIEKWISPSPPFAFTFSKFDSHWKNDTAFVSVPFYSRVRGYKMCIKIVPCNQHVGVYCCIMRGEHDDCLKWPFRGVVHIKLQNHLGDHDHLCRAVCYNDSTSDNQAGRVKTGDKNYLHGYSKFVSLNDLKANSQLNRQYLKGDALDLEVTKVEELNSV